MRVCKSVYTIVGLHLFKYLIEKLNVGPLFQPIYEQRLETRGFLLRMKGLYSSITPAVTV